MDNLTHSLAGLAIARTGPLRKLPGAAFAGVVAANLPDVDAMSYLWGPDAGLAWRRGLTHGIVAMALLPPLLALGLRAVAARRAREAGPWRDWLLLCAFGIWSHPLLDLMNVYGVRLLMPLDSRWFYADALFIVDPWLWLVLAIPLAATRPPGRAAAVIWVAVSIPAVVLVAAAPMVAAPAKLSWMAVLAMAVLAGRSGALPRRPETAAVAGAAYVAILLAAGAGVRADVRRSLPVEPSALFVGPAAFNPFAWRVVATHPDHYGAGTYSVFGRPRLRMERGISRLPDGPEVRAALAAPCVRGFAGWTRLPWYEVEPRAGGARVHVRDARYVTAENHGFGTTRVDLDRELRPSGCSP